MFFKHEPHIKNRYSTYKSIDFIITISEIIRKERRCFNTYENNYYLEVESGFNPKIQPLNIDLTEYDTVLLGAPVWWYAFAPAMKTFLHDTDLSGKTVYPFATNGGWLGHTFQDFVKECPGAQVMQGCNIRFNEDKLLTPESDIMTWIKKIQ